ncbi:holo-ACP synthase [Rhodococcus sp. O3]|uniref:holo-ACP synthase n=1 Tax=Rhodococcus sp. O3 TaxID=3404919 RepID=UPI003B66B10D
MNGFEKEETTVSCRLGCDIVSIEDVRESITRFGERYLARVFTPHERSVCSGDNNTQRLAARFAGKEAVFKVLRSHDEAASWTCIEIRRADWGGCEVHLTGAAATLDQAGGLKDIQVSLPHEHEYAMAVAVSADSPAGTSEDAR